MDRTEVIALVRLAADDDDPLRGLGAAARAARELQQHEAVLVRRARARGATWAEVAAALGVSKQAVHKKYGGGGLLRAQP